MSGETFDTLSMDFDFEDEKFGGAPPDGALPPGLPTYEDIDALIANEMNRMSLEEREKVLDEIHGIVQIEEEDVDTMDSCLKKIEYHLQNIKSNTAYALAEAMSRKYVSSRRLRMMFLRADRYNSEDAAERMIRFFDLKESLFGVHKLVKDITLDDLDENDIECLKSGCYQISPLKDMAGRTITIYFIKLRKYKVAENYVSTSYAPLNLSLT